MNTPNGLHIEINQIRLVNVTLKNNEFHDSILESLDIDLPVDHVVVFESSFHENASNVLKCLAGQVPLSAGKILWNNESIFTFESGVDPRDYMGCYFETYRPGPKDTIRKILTLDLNNEEYEVVLDYFELKNIENDILLKQPYSIQKLIYLIKTACVPQGLSKQILLLQDPASGLNEDQWLCFLDYIQIQQRKGYLRHIFMTNQHPTALRHINHQIALVEDGLIYFEQDLNQKKVSHF